jgi:hypothetical protein
LLSNKKEEKTLAQQLTSEIKNPTAANIWEVELRSLCCCCGAPKNEKNRFMKIKPGSNISCPPDPFCKECWDDLRKSHSKEYRAAVYRLGARNEQIDGEFCHAMLRCWLHLSTLYTRGIIPDKKNKGKRIMDFLESFLLRWENSDYPNQWPANCSVPPEMLYGN